MRAYASQSVYGLLFIERMLPDGHISTDLRLLKVDNERKMKNTSDRDRGETASDFILGFLTPLI